jgi:hypothetical protein
VRYCEATNQNVFQKRSYYAIISTSGSSGAMYSQHTNPRISFSLSLSLYLSFSLFIFFSTPTAERAKTQKLVRRRDFAAKKEFR